MKLFENLQKKGFNIKRARGVTGPASWPRLELKEGHLEGFALESRDLNGYLRLDLRCRK
jgi:hypothetical protein